MLKDYGRLKTLAERLQTLHTHRPNVVHAKSTTALP
jgi:hypothetical protein